MAGTQSLSHGSKFNTDFGSKLSVDAIAAFASVVYEMRGWWWWWKKERKERMGRC